jgi:hypothetical protein
MPAHLDDHLTAEDPVETLEKLQEVFSTLSPEVVQAVWEANQGQLGPSFSALFQMSNPTAPPIEEPQLQSDPLLARRLYLEQLKGHNDPDLLDSFQESVNKLWPVVKGKMAGLGAGK